MADMELNSTKTPEDSKADDKATDTPEDFESLVDTIGGHGRFQTSDKMADMELNSTKTPEDSKADDKATDTPEDFESLVDTIGGHGRFQIFVWCTAFGAKMSVASVFLFMTFAASTPDFWCSTSGKNGRGYNGNGNTSLGHLRFNRTHGDHFRTCDINGTACNKFVYDEGMNTIVSEWDLVCDDKWKSSTVTSVQMFGVLIGAATAGQVADVWGRRKTSIALLIGQFLTSLACAFSPSWIVMAVTRFGVGFCGGGYLIPYLSLALEFTDMRWRALLGAMPAWPIGAGLTALAAWLLHDWQQMAVFGAVFSLFFAVLWWFMPESVRWLLVHERIDEAQAILQRAARWNGTQAPDITVTRRLANVELVKAKEQNVYTYRDIFRSKELMKRAFPLFFIWFSVSTAFYFLAFGAETLSGNLYLNFFLLNTAEIPALALTGYLNNKIGRRWTAFLMFSCAGLCALLVTIFSFTGVSGAVTNAFIIVSKVAMGVGWAVLLLYTGENFPTVIRNIGYAACNVAARVGGIVAPHFIYFYEIHPAIPYVTVVVMMFGSALCFVKSRETNKQALEDALPCTRERASSSPLTQSSAK